MGVPVTVLSGALGAGKTTTLNHVLTADHGYETAVLVNDVGEINVDAEQVRRRVESDRDVIELSNGCICCGIQGEFERAVTDLALGESFEYLLVEPSGISDPAPVAGQFVTGRVGTFYDLESVTTVVDARQFHDAIVAGDRSRGENDGSGDRRIELVVIGRDVDRKETERRLNRCVLSEPDPNPGYDSSENPFPEREGTEIRL